jgi:hypothetical protein
MLYATLHSIGIRSEKRGIAEGFFVVLEGKKWIRFEAQNSPRTIPVSP